MISGDFINWANAGQGVLEKWSCGANNDAMAYAGSSKTPYYIYISGVRWRVTLTIKHEWFVAAKFDVVSQYWNGSAWEQYGDSQRCGNNTVYFYDRGTEEHIYRIKYTYTGGNIPEDLYGSIKIGAYGVRSSTDSVFTKGTEVNYNSYIKGKHLRLRDMYETFYKVGKGMQGKDYLPTDDEVYPMYNTKQQRGMKIYSGYANFLSFQEI